MSDLPSHWQERERLAHCPPLDDRNPWGTSVERQMGDDAEYFRARERQRINDSMGNVAYQQRT
jgi:hypothetical protein